MDLHFSILVLFIISLHQAVYSFATKDFNNTSENSIPCEDGWYYFDNKCYKVEGYENPDARLSWENATARCSELGGNLVSIHSKKENDFITAFIALNIKQAVLIGLNDREKESNFVWEDGSPFDYNNWEPGQPSNYLNREHCVEFRSDPFPEKAGQWNDQSCDLKSAYICQKNSNNSLMATDPRFCSPEDGGGWKFRDSCYNIIKEEKSWDDAEKFCQNIFYGHLVKILDVAHDTFLNVLLSQSKDRLWIGIKGQESFLPSLMWSSGWHVVYDHFDEPLEELESDLCILRWNKNIWTSTSCVEENPFICENSKVHRPNLPTPTQESRCPQLSLRWKDLGGEFCYYFETENHLSWYDAQNECVKGGGILASIHSTDEEDILHNFVKSFPDIYIGLNSLLTNGEYFIWSDGILMNYTHWSKDERSSKREKCVELSTVDMSWNDITCSTNKGFICQVEKVAVGIENEEEENDENVKSERAPSPVATEEPEMKASISDAPGIYISLDSSDTAVSGTEAVKKEIEDVPGSVSQSALYGLCAAVFFLGVMFGILIYISRKWLKWKSDFLPSVRFSKSSSYKKFQNVWSADIMFNTEDESSHM